MLQRTNRIATKIQFIIYVKSKNWPVALKPRDVQYYTLWRNVGNILLYKIWVYFYLETVLRSHTTRMVVEFTIYLQYCIIDRR